MTYLSFVIVGALLASLLYPAVILKTVGQSEVTEGAGALWVVSLPLIIIASFIGGKYTYKKYISTENTIQLAFLYALGVIVAPLAGILLTRIIIYMLLQLSDTFHAQ